MSSRHLLIVAVVAVFSSATGADTIYVDDDNCPGPGDGSELDPYCSIQTAIDSAVDTDEIVVAPGTYQETINLLGKAITLRSTDGADATTIDAQDSGTVVTCGSGEGQGTLLEGFTITGGLGQGGGMYNNSSSPTVTDCRFSGNIAIDCFDCVSKGGGMYNSDGSSPTVTNCMFTGNEAGIGGGMYNDASSSPTVTGCTFTGNEAYGNASVPGVGGGMYNTISSPTVTNCTFAENVAVFGGGMNNDASSPTVTSCTFSGNSVTVYGGGMYNDGSSLTVTNCTFTGNEAGFGGGMYNDTGSSPTVTGCTFSENTAVLGTGGGMVNSGGSPTVTGCTFSGNAAPFGGGMYSTLFSNPILTECTFSDNSALFGGGGMYNTVGSSPAVTNGIFARNEAGVGGGMYSTTFSAPTVTNCTFSENFAANGSALAFDDGPSALAMTNCILWDAAEEIWNNDASALAINHTNVQGGWPGTGNIDADPLFDDPDNGDFRLSPGSPCIDAGDNTAVPEDITTDLDGNPRFLEIPETPDTGNGNLPIVDMGAYESLGGGCLAITSQEVVCHGDGSTFTVNVEGLDACTGGTTMATFTGSGGAVGEDFCATLIVNSGEGGFCCSTQVCVLVPGCSGSALPGDFNGDGVIGVLDILALLGAWGPNPNHPADFDGNGDVGVTDLLILLANWG
jgi:hypothetical protein